MNCERWGTVFIISFIFYLVFVCFLFCCLDTMALNSWISVFIITSTVFLQTTAIYIGGEPDVGSPLRVAQCRATCLERVST